MTAIRATSSLGSSEQSMSNLEREAASEPQIALLERCRSRLAQLHRRLVGACHKPAETVAKPWLLTFGVLFGAISSTSALAGDYAVAYALDNGDQTEKGKVETCGTFSSVRLRRRGSVYQSSHTSSIQQIVMCM
jgi:hypothetical protein